MIKKYLINGVAVLALGLTVVSCSKDTDFTNADAVKHAESVLGVTIDPTQDWKMTQEVSAYVTVNFGTGEKYTVYVFDKSPFDNDDAVYYAKKTVSDATVTTLPMSIPSALTELYVSVFDSKKHSYSKRVAVNGEYVNVVFGSPMEGSYAPNFNFTRSGNQGPTYPYTSQDINANANHWADSTDYYGGWLVPDTLTSGQKLRVQKYFQANPNLQYEDPRLKHFFIQQVYKGGTDVGQNTPETVTGAGGTVYTSDKMNKLTVGQTNIHLNNFNGGTCSYNENVLDNGYTVNDANNHHHRDQIMLMVNIDDTSCFGYYNSDASVQRNDKMALVSAQTIDTWAAANGNPGEAVVDKWKRSFMGFDNALKPWKDIVLDKYAKVTDLPGNAPQYAWDGQKVLKIGTPASAPKRAAKRAKGRRTASLNLWNGNEQKENNNGIDITFSDDAKALLVAGNYLGADLSVVKEWYNNQWSYGTYSDWRVKFQGQWGNIPGTEITLNSNTTNVEIQLTDNDVTTFLAQGLKVLSLANPVIFTRIYISDHSQANGGGGDNNQGGGDDNQGGGDNNQGGGDDNNQGGDDNNQGGGDNNQGGGEEEYEYYTSEYILVDGSKQIPFVSSEINQYEGSTLPVNESDMKITKDGKECLNLPYFKTLYDQGYRPYSSSLRDWVKPTQDGDKYYSDWIVTLCEAQRIEVIEEHDDEEETKPAIYSYAFEDSWMADYDMNDVVLKVQQNADNENKIDITLCCTGAAYNLYVFIRINGVDQPLFGGSEVHAILGGTPGKFINTGDGTNEKFQTKDPYTITIDKPTSATTLGTLDIWIKSPEKNIHVAGEDEDPHGVVIPKDWQWPTEWTSIKTAYPEFIEFAKDKSKNLNWYDNPSSTPGLIYGK